MEKAITWTARLVIQEDPAVAIAVATTAIGELLDSP